MSKMKKTRKPGGGRKRLKPEYDAGKNLKEQMDAAVALYGEDCSLQSIADAIVLNPIKVRKLLITAGVYESDVAKKVKTLLKNTEKHKTTKPPYSQPQRRLTFPKPPLPRICLIRKVYTSQVLLIKKKLVLEQSGSGDTEQ